MNLTLNDISGSDNKTKQNNNDREHEEDELDGNENDVYNPNWSLRKCCSKFLDKISFIYPKEILDIVKPHLEENIQNQYWQIK
jgi:hypothetical protein